MPFPEFIAEAAVPGNPLYKDGQLTVTIDSDLTGSSDGFLGGRWFGERIWELDYLRQKVSTLGHLVEHQKPAEHAVDLGLQLGEQNRHTMRFPRMRIEVDGNAFDVLLDTGATATLTETGAAALASVPGKSIGTSFIRRGIFNAWKREHPEWTIIADVDIVEEHTYSMIQVPELVVAGYAVGPVWFTVRPDSAFLDFMSSMMDAPAHGALGGSALKYFRVIVDCPDSRAYFFTD